MVQQLAADSGLRDHQTPWTPCQPSPEAVFVHGLGTSACDLEPLASVFRERGIRTRVLTLAGHEESKKSEVAFEDVTIDDWLRQVRHAVAQALRRGGPVYLIGFSLGAALALRVASEQKVDGVLAISTFVGVRHRLRTKFLCMFRWFPPVGPRRLCVTTRSTREELCAMHRMPTATLSRVIALMPHLWHMPRDRRVLLVHSIDDPVADYRPVAERVSAAASHNVRLVTLAKLKHYPQFDVSLQALCDLALLHFDSSATNPEIGVTSWVENLKRREEEVTTWTNLLTLLLLGFFTLFSALVKATRPHAFPHDPKKDGAAPYVLFSYALLLSVYLQFVILHQFYINRAQAYIKIFLEPFQDISVGWRFYRRTSSLSGLLSHRMTSLFLFLTAGLLPFGFAITSIVYAIVEYHTWVFGPLSKYVLLQLLALAAICWAFLTIAAWVGLRRYTNVHMNLVPPIAPASHEFFGALHRLYASARPESQLADLEPPQRRGLRLGAGILRLWS